MKKRYLILWGGIIAMLFGLNIFLAYKARGVKRNCQMLLSSSAGAVVEHGALYTSLQKSYENSGLSLENVEARDSLKQSFDLKTLFVDGINKVLVVRYSENHCASCVQNAVETILKNRDDVDIEKVVFIGYGRRTIVFSKQIDQCGIRDYEVLNIEDLGIPAEAMLFPYYFVMDSTLSVLDLYVPNKATPDMDSIFVSFMMRKL
jgi:hypothetical protein